MNTIEVKPAGDDRLVPMPGKNRQYFPQGDWTPYPPGYELNRLIASGDLLVRPADTARTAAEPAAQPPVGADLPAGAAEELHNGEEH
jgi:hypothetical protein